MSDKSIDVQVTARAPRLSVPSPRELRVLQCLMEMERSCRGIEAQFARMRADMERTGHEINGMARGVKSPKGNGDEQ